MKQIEDAHYTLGNIYNFDLVEKPNAATTFEELINRYPQTEYEAEVSYLLYLIYQELGDSIKSENNLEKFSPRPAGIELFSPTRVCRVEGGEVWDE